MNSKRPHLLVVIFTLATTIIFTVLLNKYATQDSAKLDTTLASTNNFYVSPKGNNTTGTNWQNAWTELDQIKWTEIKAGDTIHIDGGTDSEVYRSTLTVSSSGTANQPITIKKSNKNGRNGKVIIFGGLQSELPFCRQLSSSYQVRRESQFRSVGLKFNSGTNHIIIDGGNWRGITIHGHTGTSKGSGNGIEIPNTSNSNITIRNIEIYNNGHIRTWQLDGNQGKPDELLDSDEIGSDGFGIKLAGKDITIERAIIRDNGQDSIIGWSNQGILNLTIRDSWLYNSRTQSTNTSLFKKSTLDTFSRYNSFIKDGERVAFNEPCAHTDGLEIYGVYSNSNGSNQPQGPILIENSIIGPRLRQGVIATYRATVDNVTIKNSLFFGNISGANIMNITQDNSIRAGNNWQILQSTVMAGGWRGADLRGNNNTIRDSIFYNHTNNTNKANNVSSLSSSNNCQYRFTGTKVGTEHNTQFRDHLNNNVELRNFTITSNIPCNNAGSKMTSVQQLLAQTPTNNQTVQSNQPTTQPSTNSLSRCSVTSDSLANAQNKFSSVCRQSYDKNKGHDCDQINDGSWLCATQNLDLTNTCTVINTTLDSSRTEFTSTCNQAYDQNKGHDCDQINDGHWLCSTKELTFTSSQPQPSPTISPQPPSTKQISIRALGTPALENNSLIYPSMRLRINGTTIRQWQVTDTLTNYNTTYSGNINEITVHFENDYRSGSYDRNLRVDYLKVDDMTYQTESETTYSVGSWNSSNGCAAGYKKSEWLSCNGYFRYQVPTNNSLSPIPSNSVTVSSSPIVVNSPTISPSPVVINSPQPPKLRWQPPTLATPTTINISSGYTSISLDTSRDYILKMPATKKSGALNIQGGRNIVLIGGHMTIPSSFRADDGKTISCNNLGNRSSDYPYHSYCRAIYISGAKGTVHIEGLLIDNSGGSDMDAFAINAPDAIVQLQNIRVDKVTGNQTNWHGDIVQPWGGVRSLRIDRFTGYTDYQGLQIATDPSIGRTVNEVIVSNTNLDGNGLYKIWTAYGSGSSCTYPKSMSFTNVWLTGGSRGLGKSVWPEVGSTRCGPVSIQNDQVIWSNANQSGGPRLQGSTFKDVVPSSSVGTNYKSPGYN